jgi:Stringent starvation protein B
MIQFSARFNGVSREIAVPMHAVHSIFARENGRGVFFDPESPPEHAEGHASESPTRALSSVGSSASTSATSSPAPPALQSVPTSQVLGQVSAQDPAETDAAHNADSADGADAAGTANGDGDGNKPKGPPRGNLRIIK